ncbi:potassium channel family protein [Mangrovivirga cuniculi]|uniref:Potassium channel domain-containing protein n=1 Tax=Mangrovivirga cuniculi TaxID=2715131 RepID=A0A4D7JRT6_9BACT|nr:potassium channel family protein [Mangrovivirga cuniculi]QCK15432.1 hypothetical protein DCC35_12095 [Mangrovivirga cuniculi]
MNKNKKNINLWINILLTALLVFTIFIINLLPEENKQKIYGHSYAFIILLCSYVVFIKTKEQNKTGKSLVFITGITLFIARFIGSYLPGSIFFSIISLLELIFFFYVVFRLIFIIAAAKKVSSSVIIEAINGYLLLGIVISLAIGIGYWYDNNSFDFSSSFDIMERGRGSRTGIFLYYGFVTLTTVGYGDLVPTSNFGRSIAIFTGIAGQLYLAVILAFLIGKLNSRKPGINE